METIPEIHSKWFYATDHPKYDNTPGKVQLTATKPNKPPIVWYSD
jgi:hypothetical protein